MALKFLGPGLELHIGICLLLVGSVDDTGALWNIS